MILGLMGLGALSALAVGPASFNIIRILIAEKTWPWPSILGFLTGDFIYIFLAMALLRTPLLQEQWLKSTLTVLTVICLVVYSSRVLFTNSNNKAQSKNSSEENFLKQSFKESFILTLGNFHLLFIYAGIFISFSQSLMYLSMAVCSLIVATFLLSFFILLRLLRSFSSGA